MRHKLSRLAADHANLLAPYNALMYLFSAVKAKPYADVRDFPELRQVTEQWQMIRDEALQLFDEGHIRAASGYNDIGFNTFFKRGWKRFYLQWYGDFLRRPRRCVRRPPSCWREFLPSTRQCLHFCHPVRGSARIATRSQARCAITSA